MRRIAIEQMQLGMVLARNIFGRNGKLLLPRGTTVDRRSLLRLQREGVSSLCIEEPLAKGIEIQELIIEETRIKARACLRQVWRCISKKGSSAHRRLIEVAHEMVDEVSTKPEAMVSPNSLCTHNDYTLDHCVNVAALALHTGKAMNLNSFELHQLTMGALLHDIGKSQVQAEILHKPGKLSCDEFAEVKKHSRHGFEILCQGNLCSQVSEVAFQHHERFDGLGYPLGLKGEEISPYARITAVADVFEALIADRPYRRGFTPHQAADLIAEGSGNHFDPVVSQIFLQKVAKYPLGTVVQLSTGEIGVITAVPLGKPNQPEVRIIYSGNTFVNDGAVIDLMDSPDTSISKVLDEEDVAQVRKLSL